VLTGAAFTARTFFLSRRGQFTDRYTKAIGQLASDRLTERLGGIYALEHLMGESERDHHTVVEVLAAFIRESAPALAEPAYAGDDYERDDPPSTDVQAALTVLGRREPYRLDLSGTNLRRAHLTQAWLHRADLCGAQLQQVHLDQAHLQHADLNGAELQKADLHGAQLQHATMNGAHLEDANLAGAQLQHSALIAANLQRANLDGAQLQHAWLVQARLHHAPMVGTQFQDADLTGARLQHADLSRAEGLTVEQLKRAVDVTAANLLAGVRAAWDVAQPAGWPATDGVA